MKPGKSGEIEKNRQSELDRLGFTAVDGTTSLLSSSTVREKQDREFSLLLHKFPILIIS